MTAWTIAPVGDRCLIVEFGQAIDPAINEIVRNLAAQMLAEPMPGIVDVVPAFTTVALHYQPECFSYEMLRQRVDGLLAQGIRAQSGEARTVEVPVCYGGEHGADLEEVASACGLTVEQVIERHVASEHQVYCLGFVPGLAYIGGLDAKLNVPRRSTPRTNVPAGSIAIASDQTVIYPLESPGGWNLIGRTPLRLFDANLESPCLLQPGDRVRFLPISAEAFGDVQ